MQGELSLLRRGAGAGADVLRDKCSAPTIASVHESLPVAAILVLGIAL